ncbi:MAG: DNA gyrase subunit A [Planctomycetota bacterium]|nr:DNA gyrase subunit A [Planctomycetota bacterium]
MPADPRVFRTDIQDEMRTSYLTYAMSVIISRALPDVRDGLKPSQRRILVAMNDLNLGPGGGRKKCAKIAGDTSGNYHPHGEGAIYPTLVRMAQEWVMREVLIDKQGNFGSLAGLPPAAMRYTEARLSGAAAEMMRDIDRETVDFAPTYDNDRLEPVVLPARFPNLLVNGSSGIAVGMATSMPPHNMAEVCEAVIRVIDDPALSLDELLDVIPGPDFPTGGIICGNMGIRQAYMTGRSTLTLRSRTHFETEKNSDVIVVTEIPYQDTRDRIREKLEILVRDERIKGISRIVDLTDRTIPAWQVRLHIVLKRDADKEVVLNQLFQYSPLQTTVSVIMLALEGNRPKLMTVRMLLDSFIRHRVDVIRRRTEFLLREARKRKHTVEGLLLAQTDIDRIIKTIRESASRALAKEALQTIPIPSPLVSRALGEDGFKAFVIENGEEDNYFLSANQSEAIVSMQLGSLANLEREKLVAEHQHLLDNIGEYLRLLSDEANLRAVVRVDMEELKARFPDKRRTTISDEELGNYDKEALIAEQPMVVTMSQRGYIKRTPLDVYEAQNRGGKGIKGATSDEEDPIAHLFVSSTHDFLLFFTDKGKVHWIKVYDLPLQARTGKGRALANLITLEEGEGIANCFNVRYFPDDQYLVIATRQGIIKKTALSAYGRPMKGGIIAIRLDDGDALVDVRIVQGDGDLVLSTSGGMAIRFNHEDARPMGRATRGVKGIKLKKEEIVVGMVVADPERTLLSICEFGYGKRTPFGPGELDSSDEAGEEIGDGVMAVAVHPSSEEEPESTEVEADEEEEVEAESDGEASVTSNNQYRRQRRGGKGVRDIKTTKRNGQVVDVLSVIDSDEVLMVTSRGKIQRIRASDINTIGRNTQGVRIIRLDEGDTLVSCAVIPGDVIDEEAAKAAAIAAQTAIVAEKPENLVEDSETTFDAGDTLNEA